MNRRQRVLSLLELTAKALELELHHLVFVGGAVVALYDLPQAIDIRATEDVDCVVDVSLPVYYALLERLKLAGFRPSMEPGAPICRVHHPPGLTLDVMPVDSGVLGFSNRWYAEGVRAAQEYRLPSGLVVKAISPLYFLATKIEAFHGRGEGKYESHDIEDVVAVLAAHPGLLKEVEGAKRGAAAFVLEELRRLGGDEDFLDALPGCLPPDEGSQARAAPLIMALQHLSRSRG